MIEVLSLEDLQPKILIGLVLNKLDNLQTRSFYFVFNEEIKKKIAKTSGSFAD